MITRRRFLQTSAALPASCALASSADTWRRFEITTRIEVLNPAGPTRVWSPVALPQPTPFQRTIRNTLRCETGAARILSNPAGLNLVSAEFPAGARPALTLTSLVETRAWLVDFSSPTSPHPLSRSDRNAYLQSTKMLPSGGIVKQRAAEITRSASTDLDKAHAIYEWIVENTYRNPKTRGCGTGDIRFMLESGDLGGKCADLNALFVGLARASDLPARDVYGLRIAPSSLCRSLGTYSNDATKTQHCRAEVYLSAYGWVPVDPADVRKFILEEPPGHLSLQDTGVQRVRSRLFGSWEMNWIAYNDAQDIALPGSSRSPIHFLMYPQAETAAGLVDSLDPAAFQYQITVRELQPVSTQAKSTSA